MSNKKGVYFIRKRGIYIYFTTRNRMHKADKTGMQRKSAGQIFFLISV